ncbi:MAG: hypothetical protein ACRDQ1_11655, partial [Sciscionella sp.]
ACTAAAESTVAEVQVGGPDVLTYEDIARAAFGAHETAPRIRHLPRGLALAAVWVLSRCTPERVYGPLQFLIAVMTHDMTAPPRGSDHLADHFADRAAGSLAAARPSRRCAAR